MARLEFFAVSEAVSVDKFTNRLSLFNILENIASSDFPFALPFATAVSLWTMESDDDKLDFQCMLRMTMPDGTQEEFTSNFKTSKSRHRVIQGFQGIPLKEPGVLRFEVLLNGKYAASHEIDVSMAEVDAEDSPPTTKSG